MEERSETQAGMAVEVVAHVGGKRGGHGWRRVTQVMGRVGRDVRHRVEHGQSVLEHVQVVKRALADTPHRSGLRQHDIEHPQPVEQAHAVVGVVGLEQPPDLDEDALAAGPGGQVGIAPGQPLGIRVDGEPQLVREPGQAQKPQRIVGEHLLGDGPQPAGLEVGAAAVGIEQVAAGKRDGHGIDREVAPAEIVGDRTTAGGDVHGAPVAHHPPGTVPLRQRERRSARAPGERTGGLAGVALDDEVDVDHRPPEQQIANAAADKPCVWAPGRSHGRHQAPATTCSTRRGRGASDVTIS